MNFLCLDSGSYVDHCNALADGGKNKVRYFTSWQKSFPTYDSYAPGVNFEYLEKVLYFFDHIEWADVIVNFDCVSNDTIKFLRKMYPKKSILGSGEAEKIELNRWALKKVINSVGLPVQESTHIIGVSDLTDFLKTHKDVFVKLNIFRGEQESFHVKDLDSVSEKLKVIDTKFACHEEEIEFVCEENIGKSIELGYDTIFSGGDYSDRGLLGIEVSKILYLAKSINYDQLPKPMFKTMESLRPVFKKLDFRGFLSSEEKIVSPNKSFFLDLCSRLMLPGSCGYPEWMKGWPELIRDIGYNKKIKLELPYKYMAAIGFESPNALNEYLYIDVKKSDRDKVKFESACCSKKGDYYSIKGMTTASVLVSHGASWQEAINNLKSYKDLVHVEGLNTDVINGIGTMAKEVIDDCKNYNIYF